MIHSASADWHTVNALSADASFLRHRGQVGRWGRVEQCFSKAVNIVCQQGVQRFTLLAASSDNAPNSCRLALPTFDGLIQPGEPVYWQDECLKPGRRIRIDFRTCQRWQPERLALTNNVLRVFSRQQHGETLALTFYQAIPKNASLFNYCAANHFYQQLAKQLSAARRELMAGLMHHNKPQCEQAFRQLLGLGIGLTPSGDDYLVGLTSVLFIDGNPGRQFYDDYCRWLQKYQHQTTPLSALTLNEAINQRYREVIYQLIAKFTQGYYQDIQSDIQCVMKIGSSSGCDMLFGMADALLLTQYFGGEYVNQDRD